MLPPISRLLSQADERLTEQNSQAKRLVQIYALVCAVAVIAMNLLSYYLTETSSGMTGLYNADARNDLLVVHIGITLVVELALLLWRAGYSGAALELARGGSPEVKQMTWAIYQPHRFLLCGLLLFARWFVLTYAVTMLTAVLLPTDLLFQGDRIAAGVMEWLTGLTGLVLAILIFNRRLLFFRMADNQDGPTMLLYRDAMQLLRGYRRWFLRIDLRFWWYYLAQVVILLLPYLTLFLPETYEAWLTAIDLGLMLLCAAATFGLELACRNRMWVTYALAYDALHKEREEAEAKALSEGED